MTPLAARTHLRLERAPALGAVDVTRLGDARRINLKIEPLPALDRPGAAVAIMDVTKWFGETSGGVKTYLSQKSQYAQRRSGTRHTLVIPGSFDGVTLGNGARVYRLRGPRIPTQSAYRFLLATRSLRRIVQHERPGIIEVGSPLFVPWVTARAVRQLGIPLVSF